MKRKKNSNKYKVVKYVNIKDKSKVRYGIDRVENGISEPVRNPDGKIVSCKNKKEAQEAADIWNNINDDAIK